MIKQIKGSIYYYFTKHHCFNNTDLKNQKRINGKKKGYSFDKFEGLNSIPSHLLNLLHTVTFHGNTSKLKA